jgi:hypothetical protein
MNSCYHYLYRITNTKLNRHYYGTRSSKVLPEKDLGVKYFSSSLDKEFIKDQKLNPDDYRYKIILCTSSRKRALRYECRIHKIFNVDTNPAFYNIARQTSTKFSTSGKLAVRDADGNTFLTSTDDPRLKTGELVSVNHRKLVVRDKGGNTFSVSKDDPRFLSGELVGNTKGRVTVKDEDGNSFSVSKDDTRYLSGELVTFWKGRKHSKETLKKIKFSRSKNQLIGERNGAFGTQWICNLLLKENRKISKNDSIPDGWTLRRQMRWD